MKKKTRADLVMGIIICAIVAAGVLGVGYIRGWFDTADNTTALLTQVKGTVNMERGGVIYPVEGDTVLRTGDKITTLPGASAVILLGKDNVTLGGGVNLTVDDPAAGQMTLRITAGEVFTNSESPVTLSFELGEVTVENATAALSVRSGAQTVSVFRGTVGAAQAGQTVEYVGGEVAVGTMKLESLNDFLVSLIRETNASVTLCFTNQDLDDLATKRQQAIQDLLNGQTKPTEHTHHYAVHTVAPTCEAGGYTEHICDCEDRYITDETVPLGHSWEQWIIVTEPTTEAEGLRQRKCRNCEAVEEATIEETVETHVHSYASEMIAPTCTAEGYTLYTCACGHSYSDDPVSAIGHNYVADVIAPTCEAQGYTIHKCACGDVYTDSITDATGHEWGDWQTIKEATETAGGLQERACGVCGKTQQQSIPVSNPDAVGYVYISILCDTVLNNMENLTPGKEEFVPADGVILPVVEVPFYKGETVFDILNRVCQQANIQIEYSWSPLYNSYYIEGINQLYELDCGEQSGWMYKVNEWFPNYGCSSYEVSDGDVIEWLYTCNGWGSDVGGPEWME